ncbi:MAG: hypothetical protein RI568_16135, partial [Natronomonas sp.]|uniref:hypothetical protein n=1 Tax=Natronomonas sp. TaxID=2184060 RepID=UPI0028702321
RFRSQGYVDLGTPYDEAALSRVNDRYNELLESGEHTRVVHTNDPMNGETYILGIDDVGKHLPEVSALLTDDIIKTLQAYYNAHIQIRTIRAYRTYHVPDDVMRETEVYNNNWHFDGKSTDHTKLFVCLDDTSEDDGPLHIMPKDDTREIVTRRPGFDRDVDGLPNGFVDETGSAVTLTGPAGTAMLGTTQSCLHRAGVPSEGHQRDLVQFYIAPSSKPLPDDWIDRELGGTRQHVVERLLEY